MHHRKFVQRVLNKEFSTNSIGRSLKDVVILSATRTPIGAFGKSLAKLTAPQLGANAIKAAIERANIQPADVEEVFMGNVLSANIGQSPARQAALGAGCPHSTEATTINKVCASGMKSIILATSVLSSGQRNVMVAGGMESMSNVPFYFPRNQTYGNVLTHDGIVYDGLTDAYDKIHMGVCAEETAIEHSISREDQDEHCITSYKRATEAWKRNDFDKEICPVVLRDKKGETFINEDEEYKLVNFDKIRGLKSVFVKGGTVTAANSSTLSDGASALVLSTFDYASRHSLKPVARIVSYADAACHPKKFTIAPSIAIPLALNKAGIAIKDVAKFEINEAFSVVARVNEKILGLNPAKVNVLGGGVSLGHPIGSSGSRIVVTLIHALKKVGLDPVVVDRKGEIGVAGICNGGGAASALVLEKL